MGKAKDLRDQTIEELQAMCIDARKELFFLKNEAKRTTRIDKPHRLKQKRKDIARLLTVLHEKQVF